MKKILKYCKLYIILISIFLLSLIITSLIPSKALKSNVQKSADELIKIGGRQTISDTSLVDLRLFTYTDALMINTAYSIDSTNPIYSFMVARKNYLPGITERVYPESIYDLVSVEKYYSESTLESGDTRKLAAQTKELYDTAYDNINESIEYARYWHGYLIFLRPLLLLFDYNTIRILSIIIFFAIISIFAYLMMKKTSFFQAIVFVIGFLLMGGFVIAASMNEITCFYIAYIASIYILLRFEKIKDINKIYFIIGAVTSFIDFFTNPIITLGIPMLVYTVLSQKNKLDSKRTSVKEILIGYIKNVLSWGIGFSAIWISKWIIVDILYNKGIIKNAITQALFRTVSYGLNQKVTLEGTVYSVLTYLGILPIIVTILMPLIYIIIPFKNHDYNLNKALQYILVSILPMLWMIVVKNHVGEHAFFTCRNFCVTITGCFLLMLSQLKGKTKE